MPLFNIRPDEGTARVITLSPRLEQDINDHIRQTEHGSYVAMEPDKVQQILIDYKTQSES